MLSVPQSTVALAGLHGSPLWSDPAGGTDAAADAAKGRLSLRLIEHRPPPAEGIKPDMEVAAAVAAGAAFSACRAALKDRPELAAAIENSTSQLRSLFPFGRGAASPERALQRALRGLPVALDVERRSLDGSRKVLTIDQVRALAAALLAQPPGTVLKLNLSHTPLPPTSAAALGSAAHEALAALSALRLRACALGDSGVAPLCAALHHPEASASSCLAELALASNNLTSASAAVIAAAVRELPRLISLDLSYNALGTEGCLAVGDALAEVRCSRASRSPR